MQPASHLVRDGALAVDTWHLQRDAGQPVAASGAVIVPLAVWIADSQRLAARPDTAVWLAPDDDPAALEPWVATLPLIAVDFPRFSDGRGYSSAYLLRNRFGFRGELRAIGDVLLDQIWSFARVGFNAFALRPDQNVQASLAQLAVFSERYQGSTDQPLPAFRRHHRPWPDAAKAVVVSQ